MINTTAILPSLNPNEKLYGVVSGLLQAGFTRIILIDDGSDSEHQAPFCQAATHPEVTLLHHEVNRGKGSALKTGFAHFLATDTTSAGVVTVDGDGQHLPEDVEHCARALEQNPQQVVLGVRSFNGENIPLRSRIGNRVTSMVFRGACGLAIADTQTGLRAIGRSYLPALVELAGERFEYETNMLLELQASKIPFSQLTIQTVYEENNSCSHFRPLRDSLRIYRLLIKFLLASVAGCVVDIAGFALLYTLLRALPLELRTLFSTAGARLCSSIVNYLLNHFTVFASHERMQSSLIRYYILCVVQMLASFAGVYLLLRFFGWWEVPSKVLVDCVLFFVSFQIQRDWVFVGRSSKGEIHHVH